jgi:hypothetical protein
MVNIDKYNFSFTACTLRLTNFVRLFEHVGIRDEKIDLASIDQEEVLAKGNRGSSKREMQELLKRYNSLTIMQKELFQEGTLDERKQILFIGVCKSNSFFRDFVIEVIREKFIVFNHHLEESDFNTFLNRKAELHEELEGFAESTVKKAKQHLWKILEEAGLIDSITTKQIIPQWLSPKMKEVIIKDDPQYLKLFLFSDADINQELRK